MVKGIEKFREHFGAYKDNYIIIGGTACEVHEDAAGQKPRATKDIDMILIVEALSHDFVAEFWKFVKAAQYQEQQVGEKGEEPKQQYYRFNKPANPEYPTQVELFSRSLDVFELPPDVHITPIPTDNLKSCMKSFTNLKSEVIATQSLNKPKFVLSPSEFAFGKLPTLTGGKFLWETKSNIT